MSQRVWKRAKYLDPHTHTRTHIQSPSITDGHSKFQWHFNCTWPEGLWPKGHPQLESNRTRANCTAGCSRGKLSIYLPRQKKNKNTLFVVFLILMKSFCQNFIQIALELSPKFHATLIEDVPHFQSSTRVFKFCGRLRKSWKIFHNFGA